MRIAMIFGLVLMLPLAAVAQDRSQTLADIRQDLTLLNIEVQRLKRELSTTGASGVAAEGATVLDRIGVIEAELSRLTGKTEEMEHRINRVVSDGTNRIGDLEFRLVELEGGDVSQLGETSTLGGAAPEAPLTVTPIEPAPTEGEGPELAMGEKTDFEAAKAALDGGDFVEAERLFAAFNENYPGGPLGPAASMGRGQALKGLGNMKEAARAYLNAYSMEPGGPMAAEALLQVGKSLGELGQVDAACQTLAQISVRFPDAVQVPPAHTEMTTLNCL